MRNRASRPGKPQRLDADQHRLEAGFSHGQICVHLLSLAYYGDFACRSIALTARSTSKGEPHSLRVRRSMCLASRLEMRDNRQVAEEKNPAYAGGL